MGLPQFSQQVGLPGDFEIVDATQTGTVGTNTLETVEVYAPANLQYQILGIYLHAPPYGDSGNSGGHYYEIYSGNIPFAKGTDFSSYDNAISFEHWEWKPASEVASSPTSQVTVDTLPNLVATDTIPITIEYYNDANFASQTGDRTILLLVKETPQV